LLFYLGLQLQVDCVQFLCT